MNCRHCAAPISRTLIDLGNQPASNAYLTSEQLDRGEFHAPLKAFVCESCWLVQLPSFHRSEDLFTPDYAYFSSVSTGWVEHARNYVQMAIRRFHLTPKDNVIEVASNDGYLLQFFKQVNIPCLGIEPTSSTAAVARSSGIESIERFFGTDLARELVAKRGKASLTVANNVLAHVPDINDFVEGFSIILDDEGVSTFEFPHLINLIDQCQFDTIYHEHYSYLSLTAVAHVFSTKNMRIFDVEKIPTHGGSLRIYVCHEDSSRHVEADAVSKLLKEERDAGVSIPSYYESLAPRALEIKIDLLDFLVRQKRAGKSVAAYGAAAKGNTLLNFAGVDRDLIDFVCDGAPAKQGKYLPGSLLPVFAPEELYRRKPDFVLILPWNIKEEIVNLHRAVRDWGGSFLVAIPKLTMV